MSKKQKKQANEKMSLLNFNYYKRNSYHSIAEMRFEETKPEKYIEMGYEK